MVYMVITFTSALLSMLEKYIHGFSMTFWFMIAGAVFFLFCSIGVRASEKESNPPVDDDY